MTTVWGQEHTSSHVRKTLIKHTPFPLPLFRLFTLRTSLNTFPTVLGVIFFNKKYENVDKHGTMKGTYTVWEGNTEAGRYKAQPLPWMRLGHSHLYKYTSLTKIETTPNLKEGIISLHTAKYFWKVFVYFSCDCFCRIYYLAVSNVFIYNIHETSHQFSLRVGLFWGFWFLQTLQSAPSPI